jgi:hypothetical protein
MPWLWVGGLSVAKMSVFPNLVYRFSTAPINFFFFSTGVLTQGLHLETLHQSFSCEGFFKIGSYELFSWAGFKP